MENALQDFLAAAKVTCVAWFNLLFCRLVFEVMSQMSFRRISVAVSNFVYLYLRLCAVCVCVCLSFCQSVSLLSFCQSVSSSVCCLSVSLSLSVCCLSVSLSLSVCCLSVSLSLCLFAVFLSVCGSVLNFHGVQHTHINFQLIQFIVLLVTPTQINTSSYRG